MKTCEALKDTLKYINWTQKRLAQESGTYEATLSEFLKGKSQPGIDTVEKWINALPVEGQQYYYVNRMLGNLDQNGISVLLHALSIHVKRSVPQPVDLHELVS
jgi:transcriptional regulator with XRE-family HTH domain